MTKPKPCTCGSEQTIVTSVINLTASYKIKCSKCEKTTEQFSTIEEAINSWNEMNKGQIE